MLQRILGALGWLGTALVVAALVVRFTLPAQQDLWWWLSVAGLVMVAAYTVGQWRDIVTVFRRRHARYGTLAATSVLLGVAILVGVNYVLTRQNKRWDLTAPGSTRCLIRRFDPGIAGDTDHRDRVCAGARFSAVPRPPGRVRVHLESGVARIRRHRQEPRAGSTVRGPVVRHRRVRLQRPYRAGGVGPGAGSHQRADQGG